jgi:CheY-like chemotaxis protein
MHILVVDDEPDIRTTTQIMLEHYGHSVDTAANGAEALDVAAKRPPNVVLLDLNMPVMDGFTAARRLRSMWNSKTLMIVVVSAYAGNREWCDRALAAGADDCLTKPLDWQRFNTLMVSHWRRPAAN